MNKPTNPFKDENYPDLIVEDFVNSLLLETQQEMIQWNFEEGPGSAAYCVCDGQKFLLIPELITSEADRYSLFYTDGDSDKTCMLMQAQATIDYTSILRDLYEAVSEQINERTDEINIFMKNFIKRSNERQAIYTILDAIKLAESTLSTLLRDIE